MTYDYRLAMEDDIREYLHEHRDEKGLNVDDLYDRLFVDDCITGNASGSYWCNAYKAQECVMGDPNADDYIRELVAEYGLDSDEIAKHFMDWEYWDVSIRCYLLYNVLYDVLNENIDD